MSFEALLIVGLVVTTVLGALGLFVILRLGSAGAAAAAVERGDWEAALAAPVGDDRDELYNAAVAAKHLLELERAAALLDRILADDDEDGEAWLERGLVAAYAGDDETAEAALERAARSRADLLESLTLHRAWLAAKSGDEERARRLFQQIEQSLETKLRTDMGAGDPAFAEWFLHAAVVWQALGDAERADWAWDQGTSTAAASRLPPRVGYRPA